LQKEFAGTIKICELGLLCAVTPKAAKALKGTLKTQATALKRKWTDFAPFGSSKKSKTVVSSSAKASGGGGGGGSSTQPPGCAGDPKKNRIQRTAEDLEVYFKKLKKDKDWKFYRKSYDRKHTAYRNDKTGEIRYNDNLHNEVECFTKQRKHSVRDPLTDNLLDKPAHEFPGWLK
jgi:hypothetical protein